MMRAIDADVMLLFLEITEAGSIRKLSYSWRRSDSLIEESDFGSVPPPIRTAVLLGEKIVIDDISHMAGETEAEREFFLEHNVRSCIGVPLEGEELARGGLICLKLGVPRPWSPDDLIYFLQIVASVLCEASERRIVENAVRESESRFRNVADSAPVMIWMCGVDKLCTYFNRPWLDFTGRPLELELGTGWTESIYGDDVKEFWERFEQAFDRRQPFKVEFRFRRHNGDYRWVLNVGAPSFDSDGTFVGYIGSCIDVDEQKKMHDALINLSGRLITSQEEERFRIARELHDDLSQRMALVLVRLDQVRQRYSDLPSGVMAQLEEVAQIADEVSTSIHYLSHELRPSRLDYLGLGRALRRLCREFSEQHGLQIAFKMQDVPEAIPNDVSVCLYRVAQEALSNVAKHSGSREASVTLFGSADRIDLCVSDRGRGFDVETADEKGGLGLLSMRERIRLVGGELSVMSQPSHGSEIRAHVPLPQVASSQQISGYPLKERLPCQTGDRT